MRFLLLSITFSTFFRSALLAPSPICAGPRFLSNDTVEKVRTNAHDFASLSWEFGVLTEALLELEWPSLSVVGPRSIPPPSRLQHGEAADVIDIATQAVANKTAGTLPLANGEGSVADPASLGVSVLLANWTRVNRSDSSFSQAATDQLQFLLNVAPRGAGGVISAIESEVQLVADSVFMFPPFLAYYGALQGGRSGQSLITEAYNQVSLYRQNLFDANASLWRHQANGTNPDLGHWATGNAWAAAGMFRVLETMVHSDASHVFSEQQHNLKSWIQEILTGVWKHQGTNGTLFNYIDQPEGFSDSAATALLAAITYRFASVTGNPLFIAQANNATRLVFNSIDKDGFLMNTIADFLFGGHLFSSYTQSWTMLLLAAYRDYRIAFSC